MKKPAKQKGLWIRGAKILFDSTISVYVNKGDLKKIAELPNAEDHQSAGYVVLKDQWIDFSE